jgi:O-antigen/teichoic acid export membrane protein
MALALVAGGLLAVGQAWMGAYRAFRQPDRPRWRDVRRGLLAALTLGLSLWWVAVLGQLRNDLVR